MIPPSLTQKANLNIHSLTEHLQIKAKPYPLFTRLYLSIIMEYSKVDKSTDCEDWLCIPHFELLFRNDDESLHKLEDDLKLVFHCLGNKEFEKLCSDLLSFSKHPTINGVHNKLLDFYCELSAIVYFIKEGYTVQRIPTKENGRTPDLQAIRENDIIAIECKFIHASNPYKTFIYRFTRLLSFFSDEYKSHSIRPWDQFTYPLIKPNGLTKQNITAIKLFIKEIVHNKLHTHEAIVHYSTKNALGQKENHTDKICYHRKEELPVAPVTIEDQVSFLGSELQNWYDYYVTRRAEQTKPQLDSAKSTHSTNCAFLYIQLDDKYNAPWEEISSIKAKIQNDFKTRYQEELTIIIKDASGFS